MRTGRRSGEGGSAVNGTMSQALRSAASHAAIQSARVASSTTTPQPRLPQDGSIGTPESTQFSDWTATAWSATSTFRW